MVTGSKFSEHVGFVAVESGAGEARIALDLADKHMSTAGRAHGGVLFSLIDTAMGKAVITELPREKGAATLEIKINYFRPVISGRITACARLLNLTKRTAYLEGEITDENDKVLARASGTFFVTDTRKVSERERV